MLSEHPLHPQLISLLRQKTYFSKMRFHSLLLLATSLISFAYSEPADVRSHPRDFSLDVSTAPHIDAEIETRDGLYRRAPTLPAGKDATKLHVWLRLDTRPITYDDRGGAKHEGLNQLIKDTGGRHVDVVVGNANDGYHEYGLQFVDKNWQKKTNGDGAPIDVYTGDYVAAPGEQFTYQGQVGDGRKTLNSIASVGQYICPPPKSRQTANERYSPGRDQGQDLSAPNLQLQNICECFGSKAKCKVMNQDSLTRTDRQVWCAVANGHGIWWVLFFFEISRRMLN